MPRLLAIARAVDRLNALIGRGVAWLGLAAVVICAAAATARYSLNIGSNAWLEIQWYMFAAMVLFGAAWTFKVNEHVRVDLIYGTVSDRARIYIDLLGGILFLMPMCLVLMYFTWPWFVGAFKSGEVSTNAGGLIRWPVLLVLPIGFGLVALQGVSEIIKCIAALTIGYRREHGYEKPLQ